MSRRLHFAGALAAFVVGGACGARTGLDAPSSSAGAGGVGGSPALQCVDGNIPLVRAEPALMFVIDASGSMGFDLGSSHESRWEALQNGLADALPPVDTTMEIGALVFPAESAGNGEMSCNVPGAALEPAVGNVDALIADLAARKPSGMTPTAEAEAIAGADLLALRAAKSARSLVLATDGGPNCNPLLDASACTCVMNHGCNSADMCLDDARTVDVIAKLRAEGLPTYVIGIASGDDAVFQTALNEMADAGGRPRDDTTDRYYPATSPEDLNDALATIRDQVGACTYLTTSIPDAGGTITVTIDGAPVTIDATGATGWSWADEANGEIVFASDACAILTTGTHTVTATVVCASDATTTSTTDATTDATSSGTD